MLTIDHKLNEGLQLQGMSVEHFAALASHYDIPKASKAKLYESFRGGKALDNATALRLWRLWGRILDLIERAKPLRLDFSDPEHTFLLLEIIGDGVDIAVGIAVNAEKDF